MSVTTLQHFSVKYASNQTKYDIIRFDVKECRCEVKEAPEPMNRFDGVSGKFIIVTFSHNHTYTGCFSRLHQTATNETVIHFMTRIINQLIP